MSDARERLSQVYGARDRSELARLYAAWASSYDTDLGGDYHAPARVVERAVELVAPTATVLDVGAGTGLVGELLAAAGFTAIDGLDMSSEMLAAAEAKAVYRSLHLAVLGENLPLPTDAYDAAVAAGVFTQGHAPASALSELVRIVRPGGHVVFSLRPTLLEEASFREVIAALVGDGAWTEVSRSDPWQPMPLTAPEALLITLAFEVGARR